MGGRGGLSKNVKKVFIKYFAKYAKSKHSALHHNTHNTKAKASRYSEAVF